LKLSAILKVLRRAEVTDGNITNIFSAILSALSDAGLKKLITQNRTIELDVVSRMLKCLFGMPIALTQLIGGRSEEAIDTNSSRKVREDI